MSILKEELALFSLCLLKDLEGEGVPYTKEQLAMAMDISESTLALYMSNLRRKGLIDRHKKKYAVDVRETYSITPEGRKENEKILKRIDSEYLTPERHNIEAMMPISTVLKRILDPLERIFFLSLYTGLKYFDLPLYLETMRTARQDSTMVNALADLSGEEGIEETPVAETFFCSCFYGDIDIEELQRGSSYGTNINALLIIAEASYKQGRLNEALAIYDHILTPPMKTSQGQWLIARAGKALVLSKRGDIEDSLELLDETGALVGNKILRTFALQVKARILSTTDRMEESMNLFDSVIRSFSTFKIPLLLAIAHNNRGILYFRMKENEKAEKDFLKSRKHLNESRREYLFGPLYTNLAGIELRKGNLEKAEEYLDRSVEAYMILNDLEGVSYVDFTRSLVFVERDEREKALKLLRRSEKIAFPSPSVLERKERREMFLDCARKRGWEISDLT
ncbi:MAG: tetratricopeptide repeat protein [Thermoplasmatota archaeon]